MDGLAVTPITDDATYRLALEEIASLMPPGTPEAAKLKALAVLVESYEKDRWPCGDVDPVDAIQARMENEGLRPKDLAKVLESSARASEVLKRRRPLTLGMIWRLVDVWRMPAAVLIRPYKLAKKRQRKPSRAAVKKKGRSRPTAKRARSSS